MKAHFWSAGLLLSLARYPSALAEPFPSGVEGALGLGDLRIRSDDAPMMMADGMAGLRKYDTILSLLKRSLTQMNGAKSPTGKRQIIADDPITGSAGTGSFNIAAWDRQVSGACRMPVERLGGIITTITDPAGVAVCYNIPYYNSSTGVFESDIRLYKIANGTSDWEGVGTKISLSVQYEGATVQLAEAPGESGEDIVLSTAAAHKMVMNEHAPASVGGAADALGKGAKAAAAAKKADFKKFLAAEEAATAKAKAAKIAAKTKAAPGGAPVVVAGSAGRPAPKASPPANLAKRQVHMMEAIKAEPQKPGSYTPRLLQALRFVGTVNEEIMQNETIRRDPAIMKLVLTPSLMLVGQARTGGFMNASVAAAQVQYVAGAFSNITSPVAPAAPFVLPGTFIAIFPLGLYLYSAYLGLFLIIFGSGTVERYLFRMSFRKRAAMMNGQDGFGKI